MGDFPKSGHIDRFASAHISQLVRFNSRFWTPDSEAIDAFICDWRGRITGGSHAPVYLVPRLLRCAQKYKSF